MNQLVCIAAALILSLVGSAEGQVNSPPPRPYLGAPFVAGRAIEAENFDDGGEGVGYCISTRVHCQTYRRTDVDIQAGGSNGYHVVCPAVGDWLAYTIDAPASGEYVFSATVSCLNSGAHFLVAIDGVDLTGVIEIPKTHDVNDWNTITSHPFHLSAGVHVMRLTIDHYASGNSAPGNFDTLFVTPVRPGLQPNGFIGLKPNPVTSSDFQHG